MNHIDTMEALLDEAKSVVTGDRQKDYGTIDESFIRTAEIWSAILGKRVTPAQVVLCMIGLKVSRLTVSQDHIDSYVDIAGYAAIGSQVGVYR